MTPADACRFVRLNDRSTGTHGAVIVPDEWGCLRGATVLVHFTLDLIIRRTASRNLDKFVADLVNVQVLIPPSQTIVSPPRRMTQRIVAHRRRKNNAYVLVPPRKKRVAS